MPIRKTATRSRYIPKRVKDAVRERDRGICRKCGVRSEYMEFDHITPYSKGAPSTVDNVQQLCRKCNLKKRDKTANCDKCGNWLPHNAAFCQSCGQKLAAVERMEGDAKQNDFDRRLREAVRIVLIFACILILLSFGLSFCARLLK